MLAFGLIENGAPFSYEIDKEKAAKSAISFQATPDKDLELYRLAYIAQKNGDSAEWQRCMAELAKSLEKYGTVTTIVP